MIIMLFSLIMPTYLSMMVGVTSPASPPPYLFSFRAKRNRALAAFVINANHQYKIGTRMIIIPFFYALYIDSHQADIS